MQLQWLGTERIAPCPPPRECRKKRKGFVEKTLAGVSALLTETVFTDSFAGEDGLLQRMDPRAKVLTIMMLIVTFSFLRHLVLMAVLYPAILLLAAASRIPLRFFLIRVWLFISLFSGLIAIPALFNVFVPGDPLLTIIRFEKVRALGPLKLPEALYITKQGTAAAALFIMRVASSVSLVVLLVLTTRWAALLKALRVIGIPQLFTFILGMTYRYIHLLLRLIEEIHLARKSRLIKKAGGAAGRRWVGSQIGVVFKKSARMSEDVYSAMLSRGYTDELKVPETLGIRTIDYLWIGFSIILAASFLWLNKALGR